VFDSRNLVTGSFVSINTIVGDSVCIQLTASNPAVNCTASICIALEPLACDFQPDFTYAINPYTCQLTLSENAQLSSCLNTDSVNYSWTITQDGIISGTGSEFILDGLEAGNATVCNCMFKSDWF
jgi:hypothetical protein